MNNDISVIRTDSLTIETWGNIGFSAFPTPEPYAPTGRKRGPECGLLRPVRPTAYRPTEARYGW